jgi:hypothetical protein
MAEANKLRAFSPPEGERFRLNDQTFQIGIGQVVDGDQEPFSERAFGTALRVFRKKLVERHIERLRNADQRRQVRLAPADNVVAIAPLRQPGSARYFGVRQPKLFCPASEVVSKQHHRNKMFLTGPPVLCMFCTEQARRFGVIQSLPCHNLFVGVVH